MPTGSPISEVYLDGTPVPSSIDPNTNGDSISRVNFGYVKNDPATSYILVDRSSVINRITAPLSRCRIRLIRFGPWSAGANFPADSTAMHLVGITATLSAALKTLLVPGVPRRAPRR